MLFLVGLLGLSLQGFTKVSQDHTSGTLMPCMPHMLHCFFPRVMPSLSSTPGTLCR